MKNSEKFLELGGQNAESAVVADIKQLVNGDVWILYFLDGVAEEEKNVRGVRRTEFLESVNASEFGQEVSDEELRILLSAYHVDWLKVIALKKGAAHPKFDEVEIMRGAAAPGVDFILEVFDTSPTRLYVREESSLVELKKRYPNVAPVSVDPDCRPMWG